MFRNALETGESLFWFNTVVGFVQTPSLGDTAEEMLFMSSVFGIWRQTNLRALNVLAFIITVDTLLIVAVTTAMFIMA